MCFLLNRISVVGEQRKWMSDMQVQEDGYLAEACTAFTVYSPPFPSTEGEKINTVEFLRASTGITNIIERFGKVFSPVIYDMRGNIKKLTDKYNSDKDSHEFIEDMILREQEGADFKATDALLWLKRALQFLTNFFQNIIDDTTSERCTQDLTAFVKKSYSESLEPYHGWLGTQLFNVLSRFVPKRRHVIYILFLENPNGDEKVLNDMKVYTLRMGKCVRKLASFYDEHHLDTPPGL